MLNRRPLVDRIIRRNLLAAPSPRTSSPTTVERDTGAQDSVAVALKPVELAAAALKPP